MPLDHRVHRLFEKTETRDAAGLIGRAVDHLGLNRIALVSSFGAEAVVLLHIVSTIDRRFPVLFLETGMLFPETLAYQQRVSAELGLSEVRTIRPGPEDPTKRLHITDPDACCDLRKVRPLDAALAEFDGWISGRKRFQGGSRDSLPVVETDDTGRLKLNPLAAWSRDEITAYMKVHDLPRHPLVAKGFASIGCAPCTTPVRDGEDPRAGRWRGMSKVECGIHWDGGKLVREDRRGAA